MGSRRGIEARSKYHGMLRMAGLFTHSPKQKYPWAGVVHVCVTLDGPPFAPLRTHPSRK